jgi:hypothetical protein
LFLIIIEDHRGTGLSAPLENCPSGVEHADCLAFLASRGCDSLCLSHYTTSNAARDLNEQIVFLSAIYPGSSIHIHGISYGTMLGNRYLAIFGRTSVVSKVSFDGYLAQGDYFSQYTPHASNVAAKALSFCELDDVCLDALAPYGGAMRALVKLYDDLDNGAQSCVHDNFAADGINSGFLRSVLFSATEMASDDLLKSLIAPLIYHLSACNKNAILTFLTAWKEHAKVLVSRSSPVYQSIPLGVNIVLSEIFLPPAIDNISNDTLLAYYNASLSSASRGNVNSGYFGARTFWPRYARDPWWPLVGSCSNCSIMMLQGELDLATPFEFASAVATAAPERCFVIVSCFFLIFIPERQFVSIPLAGHVTTSLPCPGEIFMRFIVSDEFPVNTTCVASMPTTIDYSGQTPAVQKLSLKFFGCLKPFSCK